MFISTRSVQALNKWTSVLKRQRRLFTHQPKIRSMFYHSGEVTRNEPCPLSCWWGAVAAGREALQAWLVNLFVSNLFGVCCRSSNQNETDRPGESHFSSILHWRTRILRKDGLRRWLTHINAFKITDWRHSPLLLPFVPRVSMKRKKESTWNKSLCNKNWN